MSNVAIRIIINTSDFSSSVENIPILEEELAIESIVGNALLELFGSVAVDEVKVTYDPRNNSSITDIHTVVSRDKLTEDVAESIRDSLSRKLPEMRIDSVVIKDVVLESALIQIRINEEPLTAQNLSTIIASLTDLHTKCRLIYQRRFAELIEYTQTHDTRFPKEANLIITQLTHNSPAEIKIDAGIKDIAEALKIGIDAFIQSPLRYKAAKLENEAKALETTLKEQEAQSAHEDKEQARTIEAQRTEIEIQTARLRIAQQQLELEQQRLTLQKAILEAEYQRINLAFETASKIVERLASNADEANKGMLVQALLPQLLQLGSSNGLELILPSSQGNKSTEVAG